MSTEDEDSNAPCGFAALDNLSTGESIRFEPKADGDVDETVEKRRWDIRAIVSEAEQKSPRIFTVRSIGSCK